MGLRALLKNLLKLLLVGLGGVIGAIVVIWSRANADWVTIRLPELLVSGGGGDVEYEAPVFIIVSVAFAVGVLSTIWLALAVWLRAYRRERRLAQSLERLEAQVSETRGLQLSSNLDSPNGKIDDKARKALPAPSEGLTEAHFDDFDELDTETSALLSDVARLPVGYEDSPSQEMFLEEDIDDEEETSDREKGPSGRGEETVV